MAADEAVSSAKVDNDITDEGEKLAPKEHFTLEGISVVNYK